MQRSRTANCVSPFSWHHPDAGVTAGPTGTARTEMLRAGETASLARIAAEHGFSSATRFAQFFRRKYGVYPSEMLREKRLILAG